MLGAETFFFNGTDLLTRRNEILLKMVENNIAVSWLDYTVHIKLHLISSEWSVQYFFAHTVYSCRHLTPRVLHQGEVGLYGIIDYVRHKHLLLMKGWVELWLHNNSGGIRFLYGLPETKCGPYRYAQLLFLTIEWYKTFS